MRFSPQILDDIRARLPISDVVGRKVTWDKRKSQPGRGDFWACCPFHSEKSPSFHCDDRRGIYHCFGCGASGDHFKFLAETEGLSFPEAVERLAQDAGVALPVADPAEARRAAVRRTLSDVTEIAAVFFQSRLRAPEGRAAKDYIAKRGLEPVTVSKFRIGYAPNERDALKKHLAAEGVPEDLAIEAGLLIRPEDGRASYDRFRGRLMIPINDDRGRVIAFGGRTLDPEGTPKYLNSPETPIFHKGSMLFNLDKAREPAHKAGSVIVTEGYLDAIAVYQAGIENVVAALGTAFTEDHVHRLWRLAPEPVICFDGDKAGIAAAHRAIDRMLPVLKSGYSFNFCFLPNGQDPDELIRSGGREAFLAELQRAAPLSEVLWQRESSQARIDTPERKAALEARVDELVRQIKDERVARRYRLDLRVKLSELFWNHDRPQRGGRGTPSQAGGAAGQGTVDLRRDDETELANIERILLGLCIENPDLYERHIEDLVRLEMRVASLEEFKRALYRIAVDFDDASVSTFYGGLDGRFYFVLNEVHGDEQRLETGVVLPRGHRLRERLPILKFHPSPDFVETCFVMMLERLSLRQLSDEIEAELAHLSDEDGDAATRIIEFTRERNRRREELARKEQEMAEEAKIIRAAHGNRTPAPQLIG
ncbi:DNA primase [Hartmannibacter diazotrophicus]|uniref:DNA primase n=1 Tax=Hartmannibacter diazotrophicus TaxID=1482074 RepID=A0A2C9D9W7_9HYPH|nr:DNA primase [Hartmannibacter diazotrophicus]SON56979.1 DNA primase [Hartmannibacter diazotrophicus]